ncbi:potassium transport protein [Favolaschia claudopus]|uniref:Potassium transport protein n=1 Tax=Favolaschia claudopus TaxID=2862362 RepID=A0AAW0E1B9_9AGAR
MHSVWKSARKQLNFYRVHIIFFTFTPLIFSAIFYASNGQYHISFVDSLFNCISAMTVCGLATVDLSSLTGWQQTILFIQMCLGSPVAVSWFMVYLRKYYFARKFEHIIEVAKARAAKPGENEKATPGWTRRISTMLSRNSPLTSVKERPESLQDGHPKEKKSFMRKLRPEMIRRMDNPPQLINPSGWISEGTPTRAPTPQLEEKRDSSEHVRPKFADTLVSTPPSEHDMELSSPSPSQLQALGRRLSDPGRVSPLPSSPVTSAFPRTGTIPRTQTVEFASDFRRTGTIPRTQTVEFAPGTVPRRARIERSSQIPEYEQSVFSQDRRSSLPRGPWIPQETFTSHSHNHGHPRLPAKHSGFGGFPMPHEILKNVFSHFFPKLQRRLTRTITLPRTTTLMSRQGESVGGARAAPYISFDAIVGRNSAFHLLTTEQQEELGGVEYRALKYLLWIVAGYHIGVQLIAFTVIAPYIAQSRWKSNFLPPMQHKKIPSTWFALYQVVSAYTNTGTSLVDQSMVPFQHAYPMIVFMAFLILAGNTAFPIFLRLTIWTMTRFVPKNSRANETLHFLLDHPRRCFIYLFPSHQTWFLLTIVLFLNVTDWFFFLVLDIGNPAMDSIPLHVRFAIGLLQAIAVRAAGFGIVALATLAPAVKVLYLIMMYISVYPIAMSVRSTNVYEEQSLGVFQDDDSQNDEENFQPSGGNRVTVWSRYLAMHARKQLAFDMWWLGLAVFLVCIIEKNPLDDPNNFEWFNIFSIVFELVSAYGTVGLSLGSPTQNYSLSGQFSPLSKLIVCLVMLRGRHRGLPVAIDRAVMLPFEFSASRDIDAEEQPGTEERDAGASVNGFGGQEGAPRMRRNPRRQNNSSEGLSFRESRRTATREMTSGN